MAVVRQPVLPPAQIRVQLYLHTVAILNALVITEFQPVAMILVQEAVQTVAIHGAVAIPKLEGMVALMLRQLARVPQPAIMLLSARAAASPPAVQIFHRTVAPLIALLMEQQIVMFWLKLTAVIFQEIVNTFTGILPAVLMFRVVRELLLLAVLIVTLIIPPHVPLLDAML